MLRVPRRGLRALAALGALLLASLLRAGVVAAAPAAQVSPTTQGPLAPPVVFLILLALLFGAVLVFSYLSYRNAR